MSITLQSNNFDIKYLYFLQKVKNNVKQNSYFSRLIYSNDVFSLKIFTYHLRLIMFNIKNNF